MGRNAQILLAGLHFNCLGHPPPPSPQGRVMAPRKKITRRAPFLRGSLQHHTHGRICRRRGGVGGGKNGRGFPNLMSQPLHLGDTGDLPWRRDRRHRRRPGAPQRRRSRTHHVFNQQTNGHDHTYTKNTSPWTHPPPLGSLPRALAGRAQMRKNLSIPSSDI